MDGECLLFSISAQHGLWRRKRQRCAVFGGREMGCRGWKAPSVLCAQSLTEGRREVMAFLRQGMQRMLFVTYASSEMLKW